MNKKNSGANTNTAQMCLDIFMLILAYTIEYLLFSRHVSKDIMYKTVPVVFVFIVIYILSNKEARIYNVTLFFYIDRFYKIITKSWFIAAVSTELLLYVFDSHNDLRKFFIGYLIVSYVMLLINMILSRFVQHIRQNSQAPRTAFVGMFADYQKFNYFLNKTSIKLDEIGYILKPGQDSEGMFNVLGYTDDIENVIRNHEVDQIYFLQQRDDKISDIQDYIDTCLEMGVTVRVIIDSYVMRRSNSYVSSIGTYPVITYHTITLNNYERMVKRISDIVISAAAIVISSPIMLITMLAVKLDSKGPVIFKQTRVGQNGRNFSIYKFRSMYTDAEERKKELMDQNEVSSGMMFKIKNDPRVTRVGKFIRKTSIDELPQLFNVLKGDMSLVGTRPPTVDEVAKYKKSEWRRISIKPGITGMWQVSGRSSITDFDKVVEMDLRYIDNWSLGMDLKILVKTAFVLVGRKDAY